MKCFGNIAFRMGGEEFSAIFSERDKTKMLMIYCIKQKTVVGTRL
jgi:GGDEF domain-containing protein